MKKEELDRKYQEKMR